MGRLQRRKARRKKLIYKYSLIVILICSAILIGYNMINHWGWSSMNKKEQYIEPVQKKETSNEEQVTENKPEETPVEGIISEGEITPEPQDIKAEILITATGDSLLGMDETFGYQGRIPHVLAQNNNDLNYFYSNVSHIFKADDITITNLETPLTEATAKVEKEFRFKGKPEYAKAFALGGIETVNLSNNHIYDYYKQGFQDTIAALKAAEIGYFGEGYSFIKEVKGIKIGILGYTGYSYDKAYLAKLKKDIEELRAKVDFVIINFHWGEERVYTPNETQKYLAHYVIDKGADLIVSQHPHVIQGLESYKGKIITYSLGNFAYGGHSNPADKDTYILQVRANFINKKLEDYAVRVIPASISSKTNVNDYKPTPLTGRKKEELLAKINKLSFNLDFKVTDEFTKLNKKEDNK
ncbi:CapA family protein [Clostridium tunisiense]|uniref:CapA family protein n=1 Tax=Clostridium tunisiense TaxID=219748 RepID=UPI0002E1FD12|nr:CapA family protein [Clostridium tunisiense]